MSDEELEPEEAEVIPYEEQKEMFRSAFKQFLNGTYEEYDLMEEHMGEVIIEELEDFIDGTVVFDSDINLDDIEDESESD